MPDVVAYRGGDELAAKLRAFVSRLPQSTPRIVFNAGEAIRSYMVSNYLAGQRLRRVTGRLATSFRTVLAGTDTAIVGTTVVYARPHEEGFSGVVGPFLRAKRAGGPKEVSVRAHVRHIRATYYARDATRFGKADALRAAEDVLRRDLREAGLAD